MLPITFDQTGLAERLYPFAENRNVLDIRIGILTLREKWEWLLQDMITSPSVSEPINLPANIIPSRDLVDLILSGKLGSEPIPANTKKIEYPWHITEFNDSALREDFELLSKNRISEVIPETVQVIRSMKIFIEEGAILGHCILNAETGPIYIGKNARIMEGVTIRGPFALCEGSVVKMGARIYGGTTIGPYSVVGGEIKNSVI